MSFEDDEYWDDEYSEYSLMPKSAVVQEQQYTRRTEPDRVIPTRRPGADSSDPVDELAARRQRRAAGDTAPRAPRKPQAVFDSKRPNWLNDPGFSPVDTSVPNLAGDEYDDVDFNRPELGADFDAPEFPGMGHPQRRDDRFGDFPDDVDEPYDHRDLEAYGHGPQTPTRPSPTEADDSGKSPRRSSWLRRRRSDPPRDTGPGQAPSRPEREPAPRGGVDPRSGQPGRGEDPRRGADRYAEPAASGRASLPQARPPDEAPDGYRRADEPGIRRAPQDERGRRPGDGPQRTDQAKGQDRPRRPIDGGDRTGRRPEDPGDQRYRANSHAEEYDAPDGGRISDRRRGRRVEGVPPITAIGDHDQRFRPVGAAGVARIDDQAGTGDVQARRHDQESRGGDAGTRAAPASDGPRIISVATPPTRPRVISRAEPPPTPRVIKKAEPSAPPRVVGTAAATPAPRVETPPPATPEPTTSDAEPGRNTPGGSPPDTGTRAPAPYPRGSTPLRPGDTRSRPAAPHQPQAPAASASATSTAPPAPPARSGANPGVDGVFGGPPEGPRPRRSPRTAHAIFSEGDGPWSIVPDEAPPAPHPVSGLVRPPAPHPVSGLVRPAVPRPPMEPNRPVSPEAAKPRAPGVDTAPPPVPQPRVDTTPPPVPQRRVDTAPPPVPQRRIDTAPPPVVPAAADGAAPPAATGGTAPANSGGSAHPLIPGHGPVAKAGPATTLDAPPAGKVPTRPETAAVSRVAVPTPRPPADGSAPGRAPAGSGEVPGVRADEPGRHGAPDEASTTGPGGADRTGTDRVDGDRIGAHAAPYMDRDGTLHNLRPIGHLTVSGTEQDIRRTDDTEFVGKWFAGKAAQAQQAQAQQAQARQAQAQQAQAQQAQAQQVRTGQGPEDTAHDGPHTTGPAGATVQGGEQPGEGAPGRSDGMVIDLDLAGLLNGLHIAAGKDSLTEVAEPGVEDGSSTEAGHGGRPSEATNRPSVVTNPASEATNRPSEATNRASEATNRASVVTNGAFEEGRPGGRPPAVSAADFEAIRWRLDGGTLREVVDDRSALLVLGERLDGPLADEADNVAKAGLLSMRAEVFRLLGELGMAAAASRLALAHAESARHVQSIVIAQAGLAHVLRLRGDFGEADRLFAEAAAAPVPETLLSVVHENAGRCCFDQRRHMEALDHFARAVRLGRPDDQELAERVGVCLEAVYIHVLRDGWGPYPRHSQQIPRGSQPAGSAVDEPTSEQPIVRRH